MKNILKRFRKQAASTAYHDIWNNFRNLREARQSIYNEAEDEAFDRGGRMDADLIRSRLPPDADVLDIGCGIGRIEKFLASSCGSLTGVDISENMLSEAKKRLAEYSTVRLKRNNGRDLDILGNDSFDFVFSFFVLQHVEREDAYRYLKEIHRVLRPGKQALLQFPLLASEYFEDSFLRNFSTGAPYTPARPRLYTVTEAVFFLMRAGLSPVDLILRGHEALFLLKKEPPSAATWSFVQRLCEPASAVRLYGLCFPAPPAAEETAAGLPDLARGMREAAAARNLTVADSPASLLEVRSKGEVLLPLCPGESTDLRISLEVEFLPGEDGTAHPDMSIGVRSRLRGESAEGPYVQTDSGNPFSLRTRQGEEWSVLASREYASVPPEGRLVMDVVADGECLSLYRDGRIAASAWTPRVPGTVYLRLVDTAIRVTDFRLAQLSRE